MSYNPYEVLQIDRNADEATIRAAFRKWSRTLHPDAGGSAAEFARLSEARDLLLDAERRKRFDRTGSTEQASVDELSAMARELVIQHINQVTNSFLSSGGQVDPPHTDVVLNVKVSIAQQRTGVEHQLSVGRRHLAFLEDMRRRFRRRRKAQGENFVDRMFGAEIERLKQEIEKADRVIKSHDLAVEILADFDFEIQPSSYSFTTSGVFL